MNQSGSYYPTYHGQSRTLLNAKNSPMTMSADAVFDGRDVLPPLKHVVGSLDTKAKVTDIELKLPVLPRNLEHRRVRRNSAQIFYNHKVPMSPQIHAIPSKEYIDKMKKEVEHLQIGHDYFDIIPPDPLKDIPGPKYITCYTDEED